MDEITAMQKSQSFCREIYVECMKGYEWPDQLRDHLHEADSEFLFDPELLLKLAVGCSGEQYLVLTVLSREYLPIGEMWVKFALRAKVSNFVVIATDSETASAMKTLGIPFLEVRLPPTLTAIAGYRNRGGFDGKAMAIIYCRLRLILCLVERGINVLACDIDALLIRDPSLIFAGKRDIVFQRVVYFPKPLARHWGFAACAGFIAFRGAAHVADFLARSLAILKKVSSDQIALNLALFELDPQWDFVAQKIATDEQLISSFADKANEGIFGATRDSGLLLEALPATRFFRHSFVATDAASLVVLHPNSPKSLKGKMEVFDRILSSEDKRFLAMRSSSGL